MIADVFDDDDDTIETVAKVILNVILVNNWNPFFYGSTDLTSWQDLIERVERLRCLVLKDDRRHAPYVTRIEPR